MCFTNLPVEFDENGDPYLADEAEAVERPSHAADCDCGGTVDDELAADPEGAYEAIVGSLRAGTREQLADDGGDEGRPTARPASESAGGD